MVSTASTSAAQLKRSNHFVWNDFCSWALELSKTRLQSDDPRIRRGALAVMGSVLADTLRLLHPVIPFVTEELFSRLVPAMSTLGLWLDQKPDSDLLIRDRFPEPRAEPQPDLEDRFSILQRFVIAARRLRAERNIKDSERIVVQVKPLSEATRPMLEQGEAPVCFLARLEEIRFVETREKGMAAEFDPAFELYVDLAQYVDLDKERTRLDQAILKKQKELTGAQKKLENPKFVKNAPAETVSEARARLSELSSTLEKLEQSRAELD